MNFFLYKSTETHDVMICFFLEFKIFQFFKTKNDMHISKKYSTKVASHYVTKTCPIPLDGSYRIDFTLIKSKKEMIQAINF
jgi:hypothetical protein